MAFLGLRFFFGGPEQLRAVSLPMEQFGYPQGVEVEPATPDVAEGSAEHRAVLVFQEDGERAVAGMAGNGHVVERQTLAHEGGASRLGPRSETMLRFVMVSFYPFRR